MKDKNKEVNLEDKKLLNKIDELTEFIKKYANNKVLESGDDPIWVLDQLKLRIVKREKSD